MIRERQLLSTVASYGPNAPVPHDRTAWSICGKTSHGETKVHGKKLTLCHHRCHSENDGPGTG
jgi:hypothetical protein